MELRLYERRTATKLFDGWTACEDTCVCCGAKHTVDPIGPLEPNVHGLKDDHGNPMVEQKVSCRKCGADWVDVWCRMYHPASDTPVEDDDGYAVSL